MFKKLNLLLILILALLCPQLQSTEIIRTKSKEAISNNIDELVREINTLNTNLDLLSITVSKILPEKRIKSKY